MIGGKDEIKECFFYVVANKNADFMTYLIEEVGLVPSLDMTNLEGDSLLHIAARTGNDRIIYILCEG